MGAFITPTTFRRVTAQKVVTLPTVANTAFGTVNAFTVVGEGIYLVSLYGYLSSAITGSGPALTFSFVYNPTANGSVDDLGAWSGTTWTTSTALGSMLGLPDTISGATRQKSSTNRATLDVSLNGRVLRQAGTIQLGINNNNGGNGSVTGGQLTLYAIYEPHAPGAYLVPV